jgi:hypothetical protein
MTTAAAMRAVVRRDLHDEDAASYRWTDNEIDRHVNRALRQYSLASPQQKTSNLTTTAGSRDLSLAALADLMDIVAVEYPTGKYPKQYQRWQRWGATLTLLVDAAPAGAEPVALYYTAEHSLATLPTHHEEIVAGGAAAYAALEWANYAVNRINLDQRAAEHFLTWGRDRLAQFRDELRRLRAILRPRTLYAPATLPKSQTTDPGPA